MNFYSLDDIPDHLRSYFQPAPQIGLESTVSEYVQKMVQVFRGVRRVLRDDGTVWLNLGDSYNSDPGNGRGGGSALLGGKPHLSGAQRVNTTGLKPKDLIGIPWRVAFALQADGWYLRSDIIWAKPNPMPESVTDRPTKSHEYLFLLAKSERYYYDSEAIKEPSTYPNDNRKARSNVDQKRMPTAEIAGVRPGSATYPTRNKRSVWTVATRPYKEAHFATYPVELVQPCILAGCPEGGVVLDPFNGAATTGVAAIGLGRDYIGLELNPEYVQLSNRRLSNTQPALIGVTA